LIDKLEEEDIPGLLLLIDFDVMGRQFLRKCFGFPSFGMHVINP
jgi:hypothetical protein